MKATLESVEDADGRSDASPSTESDPFEEGTFADGFGQE